jgi:arginine utilization protein RocB
MEDDMTYSWQAEVARITRELVRCPSITNSPGENDCVQLIHRLIAELPYFQAHPEHLRLERTTDDPYERYNLYALVEGNGPRTVLLTGHYDVVSTDPYGALAPWACDPDGLLPRLMADLEQNGRSTADALALADLRSGQYMPGRGALDMKSGLAAGMAVLARFAAAERERAGGSLLFIATPDEEDNSHGMRAVAARLPELVRAWGLEPVAAINLDATNDRGDGSEGRAVFLGSVGKLLPAVYLVGRETHAGRPFDGVNPNLLAAMVTRRIECAAALVDVAEGEAAPPPVSLKQTDLKDYYDVTTPTAAWCTYNLLTHGWPAGEALLRVSAEVRTALDEAMAHLREEARRYGQLTGAPAPELPWEPVVLTFAELKARALEQGGERAAEALSRTVADVQKDPGVDLRAYSRRLIEALWPFAGLAGPAAVVSVASLYYPRVHISQAGEKGARLQAAVERHAAAVAAASGCSIRVRPFFPGISDMSFLGCADSPEDLAALAGNTPAWGSRLRHDYRAVQPLGIPVVNLGPWGRDYHQRTERVNMPYSFQVVPELLWRVATDLVG